MSSKNYAVRYILIERVHFLCRKRVSFFKQMYLMRPWEKYQIITFFQGFLWSLALALAGSCFVSPVFFKATLKSPGYLDNFYCEVDWPKENRYHYTIITTAAHYFLTLGVCIVLYTGIYLRLKSR